MNIDFFGSSIDVRAFLVILSILLVLTFLQAIPIYRVLRDKQKTLYTALITFFGFMITIILFAFLSYIGGEGVGNQFWLVPICYFAGIYYVLFRLHNKK